MISVRGKIAFLPLCLVLLALSPVARAPETAVAPPGPVPPGAERFSRETVIEQARLLAQQPFVRPAQVPEGLAELDYSEYRKINYQQEAAVWGSTPTRFSVQLFAPGYLYRDLVDIEIVENGRSRPLELSADSFRVPHPELAQLLAEVGKYAGFRLHYPLNRADYADEFLVFQGASYFRGVSAGQLYGLSARGLAIDVAGPRGEEHPIFRKFWLERPSSSQESMVVHAVLDSRRVTGAYRFGIYPGNPLRMDVEATLFPREDIEHVGLAPLTSMFMHGPLDHADVPDYRPAVHDSEGLAIRRSNGEWLWRPLANPRELQVSAFIDENPAGFGLVQRRRDFEHYQDLEASYELRPSAWVQPLGDWGKGHVHLVEIPSDSEGNDNIVAYWRPDQGLRQGEPFTYAYRLTWPDDVSPGRSLAPVVRSAGGRKLFSDLQEVMIDYAGIPPEHVAESVVHAAISRGRVVEARVQPNPAVNGARVFLNLETDGPETAEIRVDLKRGDEPRAETWLYRWVDDY